jgi:ribosomal-protein-alanine N-acetyltransferase
MRLPDLNGTRIRLGALDPSGLDDLFEYSSDARFYRYLEFPPHATRDQTADYLAILQARSARDDAYYWFVRRQPDDRVIGTIGVHHIDWRKQAAEIGYGIGPSYQGRGYFAEALGVLLAYAFGGLHLHRIAVTTPRENEPSLRALAKAGFTREGVLRDYYLAYDGRRYDAVVLSLLQPDYAQRRIHLKQERSVSSGDAR